MKGFINQYLPDKELKILDLGSRVVSEQSSLGSYRQFCINKKWKYTGADIEAGENVDVVLSDGYIFPFGDETFDIVLSGQTIEHMEYPWVWFREMARVLKRGGACCIIAPALFREHKYPIDTFRYYPDGMRALAKWSGLQVIKTERIAVKETTHDTYLFARKP
jgi:SAM-dependent methyltransferase